MAIIGALPVTLVNGTTADAVQVMADFNWILSQVNLNAAPLASPSLTGTPIAPTAAPGTNTTQLATTAFVTAAGVAGYLPLAGGTLTGALAGTTITAKNFLQTAPASGPASLFLSPTGNHQWQVMGNTDNGFYIVDITAGNVQRLVINAGSGDVSISAGLFVATNVAIAGNGISYTGVGGANRIAYTWNGTLHAFVDGSNVGTVTLTSDEKLKRNIAPIEGDPLDELRHLELISYDFPDIVDETRPARHIGAGFSAQQIETVLPDSVVRAPARFDKDRDLVANPYTDEDMRLSPDVLPLLARCVGAIQQLAARVEALEKKA